MGGAASKAARDAARKEDSNSGSHSLEQDDWCFIEAWQARGSGLRAFAAGPLDEEEFKLFAPFLAASQDYAGLSGCRFRSDSFSSLEQAKSLSDPRRWAAKRSLKAAVQEFAARLRAGEEVLLQETAHALNLVMAESVRNAMTATFRELDLWPPSSRPPGISDDDCAYDDLSAPIEMIAQRAWNDEMQRQRDASNGGGGGAGRLFRRAVTASYIVDFVHAMGVHLQQEQSSQLAALERFGDIVSRWESQRKAEVDTACREGQESEADMQDGILESLEATGSLTYAAWAVASTVLIGFTGAAGLILARRSHREDRANSEEGLIMRERLEI